MVRVAVVVQRSSETKCGNVLAFVLYQHLMPTLNALLWSLALRYTNTCSMSLVEDWGLPKAVVGVMSDSWWQIQGAEAKGRSGHRDIILQKFVLAASDVTMTGKAAP